MTPRFTPVAKIAIAVPLSAGLKRSDIIECEGGFDPASPTPTPILNKSNCQNCSASPQNAVIRLQTDIEKVIRFLLLCLSAHIAIGIAKVA